MQARALHFFYSPHPELMVEQYLNPDPLGSLILCHAYASYLDPDGEPQ